MAAITYTQGSISTDYVRRYLAKKLQVDVNRIGIEHIACATYSATLLNETLGDAESSLFYYEVLNLPRHVVGSNTVIPHVSQHHLRYCPLCHEPVKAVETYNKREKATERKTRCTNILCRNSKHWMSTYHSNIRPSKPVSVPAEFVNTQGVVAQDGGITKTAVKPFTPGSTPAYYPSADVFAVSAKPGKPFTPEELARMVPVEPGETFTVAVGLLKYVLPEAGDGFRVVEWTPKVGDYLVETRNNKAWVVDHASGEFCRLADLSNNSRSFHISAIRDGFQPVPCDRPV